MMKIGVLIGAALVVTAGAAASLKYADRAHVGDASAPLAAQAVTTAPTAPRVPLTPEEAALYRDAARLGWQYMERNYDPATGLVKATPDWANTTVWDVGAQILAFHAAKELDLLPDAEYHARTALLLRTLERMELVRGAAYGKQYSTQTGALDKTNGGSWSATDLGRLMVALKVLATREPQYAAQAERIVRRMDMKQIVKNGYVHGQMMGKTSGKPWTFQEGRIGYEQYIARGFAAWGADVAQAMAVSTNARPVQVMGVPLMADKRKMDRLLSEPFVLLGLELGLPADMKELAENLLAVQEKRFRTTGQVTMVSEDAVAVKPTYFYYYCVYCNGKEFVIDISSPGNERTEPRWVSTKAAFGWHALMPSDYTKTALDHVAKARDEQKGWASGVFESTGASTATYDINTSAVLLEAAYYQLRGGKPHIQGD
jgi:hypothetical protein